MLSTVTNKSTDPIFRTKVTLTLIIAICLSSCLGNKKTHLEQLVEEKPENKIVKPGFQSIIDSSEVKGAILIYDLQNDIYYSNNFDWANTGKLPASTFKIINSMIGLETGIIEGDQTVFKWDGEKKWMKKWEQDLILKDAFHFSCVPCYQEVARNIGEKRMNAYLKKMEYGTMNVDENTIDNFWLEGTSHISQMQQIDFLKRFYNSELPISDRTYKIMKSLLVVETNDTYKISAKTGLSNYNKIYNGWFVGYMELESNTYFFATNLEPKEPFDFNTFIKKRKEITFSALKELNIF